MVSLSSDIGQRRLTLADKVRGVQWGLVILVTAISGIGFAMLYSAANGSLQPWASRQMIRFAVAFIPMVMVSILARKMGFRTKEVEVEHLPRMGGTQSLRGLVKWARVGSRCARQLLSIRMSYPGRMSYRG